MKITNPEKLGLSKEKIMAMENFFKEKYIQNGKLAGVQTLIARKGKVIHFKSRQNSQRKGIHILICNFT